MAIVTSVNHATKTAGRRSRKYKMQGFAGVTDTYWIRNGLSYRALCDRQSRLRGKSRTAHFRKNELFTDTPYRAFIKAGSG